MAKYSIGLDFGTNSARALLVNVANGQEIATSVCKYAHGHGGIILDSQDPHLARQHPQDYLDAIATCVKQVMANGNISPNDMIGLGVDTTGSTPLPVDRDGEPLAFSNEFKDEPAAMAWLWKDHTSHAEAQEITDLAVKMRPEYLAKCGGKYSSEWFWSKILHCLRATPRIYAAAYTWVEIADWIPAVLTGTTRPDAIKRNICAAGHKAMFNPNWNGYPDEEFLGKLDEKLIVLRHTLPNKSYNISQAAGRLTEQWAKKLGLSAGIPVAVGAFDAHLGAVGSGIKPGVLVKIIGTSTCDMLVAPLDKSLPDIPGLCGVVPESILPEFFGLEAGQSAVGDIFNWFVNQVQPGGAGSGSHESLTAGAERLAPGQSGLLGLDWHNGNRTVLVDQRLTGMLVGMTLATTPAEIYRALIESTAFGARVIIERFEEYGLKVDRVVNCGGISAKNALFMQIYADVLKRPLEISRSDQTCALGAAIAAAVVAGDQAGGHADFDQAIKAMTGLQDQRFTPNPANTKVYDRLYALYKRLHDAFGVKGGDGGLTSVMKELLIIREQVNE